MSPVIERAARAAREAAEKTDEEYKTILDSEFEAMAQAVLQSLLPPDEAMVEAGARAMFLVGEDWETKASFDSLPDYAQDNWRALSRANLLAAIQSAIEGAGR